MWCRHQCLCYITKSFHSKTLVKISPQSAYLHIILDISSVLCRLTIDMDYWLWPGLLQVGTTAHSVPALVWRNKTSDSMLQHHNSQTCKQCLTVLKCESIQYSPTLPTVKIHVDKSLILIDLKSVKAQLGTFNYEKVLETTSPSIALSILNIVNIASISDHSFVYRSRVTSRARSGTVPPSTTAPSV